MKDEERKLVLSKERPVSWNEYYSGSHWSNRNNEAVRVHSIVRAALDPETEMFQGRVDIEVVVYADSRPMDPDNVCAKLYIDGLKGWWIEDDTHQYVRKTSTRVEVDKDNPRTEIIVKQIENDFQYKCVCCEKRYPTKKMKVDHEKTMG